MMQRIYGAIVWFIATLFVIYAFCLNTAAAVFSGTIKTSLHASDVGAAIAVGAFIAGFACMQIPAGYLLDKFNTRIVVSSGVFLLALGNIIISYSNNLFLFALSNLIQGIGGSFAFIAAGVLISQWFEQRLFPILFGFTQTLSCILAGVMHYYFVHKLQEISWNTLYQYMSIYGFGLFVLTLILVKSPSDYRVAKTMSLKKTLGIVLENPQMWLCTLCAATSFGVLLAYASFWYISVQTHYSVNMDDALILSGLIFAGIGIGTPCLGWLSNVVKSRTKVIHISLCLGNIALILGIYLPHFDINTLIPIKAVSFLIGFFLSGSMLFYTAVSEFSSDATRGVTLSVINTGVFLFNTLMMFIPYLFITKLSPTFYTSLWIFPVCLMVSILLLMFVKETYKST